ncbi:MAG: hypothetical protein K2R93_06545 [Gemmatimonadaceae bacterium]|nr:hypothetical protein [Gemmatimonadaceae bacterium]
MRLAIAVGLLMVHGGSARAQAVDTLPSRRWALEALVSAGASAWSQPVLPGKFKARPAGGAGLALSHVHSSRWRGVLVFDRYERGAIADGWTLHADYSEIAALVMRRLFPVGVVDLALGGGAVIAWPANGTGTHRLDSSLDFTLDPSPQEYSARLALEARTRHRLPVSGRITFQRGLNRILRRNPSASNGRWDGTTPPYSKLLAFELGATLLRW